MPSAEELRGLNGRRVTLALTAAGGDGTITGRIVGTLEAADGLVVVVVEDGLPGHRSVHYQHVSEVRTELD